MYSNNNTERGFIMKAFVISLSIALGFVGLHVIVGWLVTYVTWLAVLLMTWGFVAMFMLFLRDMEVVSYDLSKVFSRTPR